MNTLKSSSVIARHCTLPLGLLKGKQQQLFKYLDAEKIDLLVECVDDTVQYMTPDTKQYNYSQCCCRQPYRSLASSYLFVLYFSEQRGHLMTRILNQTCIFSCNVAVAPDIFFTSTLFQTIF